MKSNKLNNNKTNMSNKIVVLLVIKMTAIFLVFSLIHLAFHYPGNVSFKLGTPDYELHLELDRNP